MTPASNEPTARAQAVMERVLALMRECRLVLRTLELNRPAFRESPDLERLCFESPGNPGRLNVLEANIVCGVLE